MAVAADPTIRRQVVAAAREELAADPDAPVQRIASRAGVSRATFYRHFGSRAAVLEAIEHTPRPPARERIMQAAQDMLVRATLAELSMDELARAADVSRGTLYRLFPGKAALMEALIDAYAPFEAVRAIVGAHRDEEPRLVLPLVARAIVGVAGERLGLMRAVFLEVTAGTDVAVSAMRPQFTATLRELGLYLTAQMAAGRVRPMHPLLALQAFIGPIFFHLLSRPTLERLTPMPMTPLQAVDELALAAIAGLEP